MRLVGTVLLALGVPLADPIASIVVATVIAYEAVKLFRTNFSQLLGRSAEPGHLDRIRSSARSVPGVLDVTDVRAEYVGPEQLHAGLRLAVAADTTVAEGEQIIAKVRRRVHDDTSESAYCVIELEPLAVPAQPVAGSATRSIR